MSGPRPRRDHYAVLGVPPSATPRQITTAYRRLARSLHPDTRPGPAEGAAREDFAEVVAAYDTLRDRERRAAYDAERGAEASRRLPGTPIPVRRGRSADAGAPAAGPASVRRRSRPEVADLLVDPPARLRPAPLRAGPVRVDPPMNPLLSWLWEAGAWM
jgi:curved DNA-binding protein CbpA